MKQSGASRVVLATALVAISIMTMKTLMPALPLSATVIAALIGLTLIFSLYRSDARRRRDIARDSRLAAISIEPMTSDAIRHRLETRPLPQIRPGPLSRDLSSPQGPASPLGANAVAVPANVTVLELAQPSKAIMPEAQPVLELTDFMALATEPEATFARSST